MSGRARQVARWAFALVLLLGPVVVYLSIHGDRHSHTWQILAGVYLVPFAIPANIIGTRRWFRERAEEDMASDAFAQRVADERLTR